MLNKSHAANLLKVAEYLESGRLKARFTMARICDEELLHKKAKAATCGSAGDVLGHGPYAGVPKFPTETWASYRSRAFGVDFDTDAYKWLYAYLWAIKDNTSAGAAKRIRIYLDNEGVPENWQAILYAEKKGSASIEDRLILIHESHHAH